MLLALLYSWLRLLLDLVDVRLQVHDPEAELLLLRHQLRVVRRQVKRPQLNAADRTIMAALSLRVKPSGLGRDACPAGDRSRMASPVGEEEVGGLRTATWPGTTKSRSRDPGADSEDGERQPEVGLRSSYIWSWRRGGSSGSP